MADSQQTTGFISNIGLKGLTVFYLFILPYILVLYLSKYYNTALAVSL